jgi:endonuclease/exonuclease/phosphatase (EEP) superfamily protein YafD
MSQRIFSRLIFLAALALTGALALGFLGQLHPRFDSFAHFRAHLAVLLGIAGVLLLALRRWTPGVVAVAASLLAVATTSGSVPWLGMRYGALHEKDPKLASYTLLHFNLLYNNSTPNRVLSLIGRLNPDVLALNEVSPEWRDKLKLISATYRYQTNCSAADGWPGVAIVSRRPFAHGEAPFCDDGGAMAVAPIDFGGQIVDVATLHLNWPWPYPQDSDIDRLSPMIGEVGANAIVSGDLNAVPWSYAAKRVTDAGDLTHMPSPGATWLHSRLPTALFPLGLPIDNVFAKGDVLVQSIQALGPEGSDHLPLLVTFSIKPAVEQEREPDVDMVGLR